MKRQNIGRIRPSQVITTFGPGAIVDLREDSAMIAAIDLWPQGRTIHERFLADRLHVREFQTPHCAESENDIPVVPFPDRHVCPICRRILDLSELPLKIRAARGPHCPECSRGRRVVRTYPARLVVVCPDGHIDDFPWSWWVHRGGECPTPQNRGLLLKSRGTTSTLSDLRVECHGCDEARSLQGALGASGLKGLSCSGRRPWAPGPEEYGACGRKGGPGGPRGSLRGATNLYFSSVDSQLSIPPWSDPLEKALDGHWKTLSMLQKTRELLLSTAREILSNFDPSEVDAAIEARLAGTLTPLAPREEEYLALSNPPRGMLTGDFRTTRGQIPPGSHLDSLVLVQKLREVRVLTGFSRIDAPDPERPEVARVEPWAFSRPDWLPGVELRGEGLFFQLAEERLRRWEALPAVRARTGILLQRESEERMRRKWPPVVRRPGFLLLHTFSHLLINVLSLECGYSSASLRERVYAGPDQNGVLIYTGSTDSDGSLGGLLRQGALDRLPRILRQLRSQAMLCSGDPLCFERSPELLTGTLNGVACHSCTLVSETSCEHRNRLLDRALLYGLPGSATPGFFTF